MKWKNLKLLFFRIFFRTFLNNFYKQKVRFDARLKAQQPEFCSELRAVLLFFPIKQRPIFLLVTALHVSITAVNNSSDSP